MTDHEGLRARGLAKRFGPTIALDDVDLDVAPGRVVAVTGANGVGKTTLLRVFATLLRPDAGRAWVNGIDVVASPDRARRSLGVALVNERGLYWRLSVAENLRFFARANGFRGREAGRRAIAAAEMLGIGDVLGRRVARCSAGQRQRAILARAVIADPATLLLDEPLRGLDPEGAERAGSLVRGLAARGCAVLIASPSLDGLAAVCDSIVELAAGRVRRLEGVPA